LRVGGWGRAERGRAGQGWELKDSVRVESVEVLFRSRKSADLTCTFFLTNFSKINSFKNVTY
jgi:hypothetical protein